MWQDTWAPLAMAEKVHVPGKTAFTEVQPLGLGENPGIMIPTPSLV